MNSSDISSHVARFLESGGVVERLDILARSNPKKKPGAEFRTVMTGDTVTAMERREAMQNKRELTR